MRKFPKWYDSWKTRNPEDEAEAEQLKRERAERDAERADDEYDRRKDERLGND